MEVAFQARLKTNADGEVVLDEEWFGNRLDDCKLTLKLNLKFRR